jgi:hypothetical protein
VTVRNVSAVRSSPVKISVQLERLHWEISSVRVGSVRKHQYSDSKKCQCSEKQSSEKISPVRTTSLRNQYSESGFSKKTSVQ